MVPARYTALAVDDKPDVLDFVDLLLSDAGFAVLNASNGEEALRLLEGDREGRIDRLFSDAVMPGGMSGFAMAMQGRARRPNPPVVLISGDVPPEAAEAISQGHFSLLAKPYRPAQLLAAINEALGRTP